jgi:hypothetical protein
VSGDLARGDVNEGVLVDELLGELTRRCGAYPGPTPAGWAYLAAAAVRGLNHASLGGDGYPYPGDVDAVVAELHTLAQRLPQALLQAARALAAAHDAGEVLDITDPAHTDTTVDIDVVGALNVIAAGVAGGLQVDLARVHSATSRLAYAGPFTDDDPADDQADDDHRGGGAPDRADDHPTPTSAPGVSGPAHRSHP